MAVNKFVYDGEVKFDLTADTVTAERVLAGFTAHDAAGNVLTGTCKYDVNSQDATVTVDQMLDGATAYARGNKYTGTMPNKEGLSFELDSTTSVSIPMGFYDGSGTIKIKSTELAKLIASNIKQGITILGVTGTLEPSSSVKVQAKTVTPKTSAQTVIPDSTYDYLSQVVVNAIPYTETDNAAGGTTITIGG